MDHQRRYQRVWRFLHRIVPPILKRKFNYTAQPCAADGPLLVLANHNTDWDPLLLGLAFPNYLSFVASEHIFRWGLAAKLLRFFLDPIARLKGTTAGDTALTVMRRLRKGGSVAIFAEGNRSFNGVTCPIFPATGKLAKLGGATLVTYKTVGGYLSSPRWSRKLRRGKMRGQIVGVYPPEKLKSMTPDEINACIARDLYEDAYARQEGDMVRFKGRAKAEHLETALFVCPKCGKPAVVKIVFQGDSKHRACKKCGELII